MSGGKTREKRQEPCHHPSFKHARTCPASPRKGSRVPKQCEGERLFLIPEELDILGHRVSIVKRSRTHMGNDDGHFGNMIIELADDDRAMPSTLLHEIIEAIRIILELKLDHAAVCGLEVGLHQVFTANYRKMVELFYREGA